MSTLKRTPLYDQHKAWGARMVEFGGWEMPVQYQGVMAEHHAVRNAAGLFDISHMGRFMVEGTDATAYLQQMVTCDITRITVGQSTYGLLCHPHGGIIDDVFIYQLADTHYLVVVNAANLAKDWDWLQQHTAGYTVQLTDNSTAWAMLALQGPAAETLFAQAPDIESQQIVDLPFHQIAEFRFCGVDGLVGRTGYTGEDGFELFFDATHAPRVWEALLKLRTPDNTGVVPCGLGARDSLRFEPCLALYGHEINDDINPYEARLGWTVKLNKGDFVGREALAAVKEQGVQRKLTGFEMIERGVPRGDYPILAATANAAPTDSAPIGFVTTGMPSPTLGKPLGLGYVPVELSKPDSEFAILIRGRSVRARAVRTPFYQARYKK